MPLYDYRCKHCGDFRSWQSMNESDADVACPSCEQRASRLVAAPSLALMPANNRIAHTRNEKSADQPEVVTRSSMKGGQSGSDHGHQCNGGGHQHGGIGHSHGRPWMIGH
ncbi:MAG: FmdB family zinc ribbon protein [Geminicoccaceae bacterium]